MSRVVGQSADPKKANDNQAWVRAKLREKGIDVEAEAAEVAKAREELKKL